MNIRDILLHHIAVYPLMQPTDAVKLAYQAVFGGGHMIKSRTAALDYIRREYDSAPHGKRLQCESLGRTARIYLDSDFTDTELSAIAEMFCESAKQFAVGYDEASDNDKSLFSEYIDMIVQLCRDGCFDFSMSELEAYLTEYRRAGYPPVSHSERYRETYRPAYRVIDSRYVRLIPCIRGIASLIDASDARVTVAIDGRCASGKTTAAKLLAGIFDAEIIHMDDFFLPPKKRYPERLGEIGGNIDYERFSDEVLPFIKADTPFEHRVFDCSVFDYSSTPRTVKKSRVIIVEGSYALHPSFGKYYDMAVFLDISPQKQLERIRCRNGEKMLSRFKNDWIPMEERYFDGTDTRGKCDFIIE